MTKTHSTVVTFAPSCLWVLREGLRSIGVLQWIHPGCALLWLLCIASCALPGSTRPVLKLGLVAPFEGWHRLRGYDALWGARLAIQEVNDRGGPAGHLVELVVLDDHLDPRWAVQRAQELVADPAVVGVVGCLSSSTVEAARGVYSAAGLPLITLASVEASGDSVFVLAPAPDALALAAMDHIQTLSTGHQPPGSAGVPALLYGSEGGAWARTLQAEMERSTQVELKDQDWLEALVELRPDWVICTAEALLGGQVLRQARDRGLSASFVSGPDWQTDAFDAVAGDAGWGAWFVTGVPRGEDLRGAQSFRRAYRASAGHEPGRDAAIAYDAMRTLLAALEEAIERDGHSTRQGIREALAGVSLEGVTGPVRFDQLGARVDAPIWIYPTD